MMRVSCKRLGVALLGLAVPFMLVAPAAADTPGPDEVAAVSTTCILGAGIDISTCTDAVVEGIFEVVEAESVVAVDLGIEEGAEPGDFPYDINVIAINPLPPPVPAVPGIVYP